MSVRSAIDAGDVAELGALLLRDPSAVHALVEDGRAHPVHALHYICDKVFDRTLTTALAAALARTLIAAGADVDYQNGDPLNAAASLGVPDVAYVLLEAGARPELRGPGGETPLHWASYTGAAELVDRLIALGAPLDVADARHRATPLGWALHGWSEGSPPANQGGHRHVVLALARAGARIEPGWRELAVVRDDPDVARALETAGARDDRRG